jgi:hypothetical protein
MRLRAYPFSYRPELVSANAMAIFTNSLRFMASFELFQSNLLATESRLSCAKTCLTSLRKYPNDFKASKINCEFSVMLVACTIDPSR